jgi:hypothetical protein
MKSVKRKPEDASGSPQDTSSASGDFKVQVKKPKLITTPIAIPPLPSLNSATLSKEEDSEAEESWFTNIFDKFKSGDLIFGLINQRNELGKQLIAQGFNDIYANDLNLPVVPSLMNNSGTTITHHKPHIAAHHQYLTANKAYLAKPNGKPIPASDNPDAISAAYRRACKLLLINRDPNRTSNAHIITDGIDWVRLCHKWDSQKKQTCHAITGSEIRAVYRHEKEHGRNPHIFFYDKQHMLMRRRPWETFSLGRPFQHYEQQLKLKK